LQPFLEFFSGDRFVGLVFACVLGVVVPLVEELVVFLAEGFEVDVFSFDHGWSWWAPVDKGLTGGMA